MPTAIAQTFTPTSPLAHCKKCGDAIRNSDRCVRCNINPSADLVLLADDEWDDIGALFEHAAQEFARGEDGGFIVDIEDAKRYPAADTVECDRATVHFQIDCNKYGLAVRAIRERTCVAYIVEVR